MTDLFMERNWPLPIDASRVQLLVPTVRQQSQTVGTGRRQNMFIIWSNRDGVMAIYQ